jgi:hypothetical protein
MKYRLALLLSIALLGGLVYYNVRYRHHQHFVSHPTRIVIPSPPPHTPFLAAAINLDTPSTREWSNTPQLEHVITLSFQHTTVSRFLHLLSQRVGKPITLEHDSPFQTSVVAGVVGLPSGNLSHQRRLRISSRLGDPSLQISLRRLPTYKVIEILCLALGREIVVCPHFVGYHLRPSYFLQVDAPYYPANSQEWRLYKVGIDLIHYLQKLPPEAWSPVDPVIGHALVKMLGLCLQSTSIRIPVCSQSPSSLHNVPSLLSESDLSPVPLGLSKRQLLLLDNNGSFYSFSIGLKLRPSCSLARNYQLDGFSFTINDWPEERVCLQQKELQEHCIAIDPPRILYGQFQKRHQLPATLLQRCTFHFSKTTTLGHALEEIGTRTGINIVIVGLPQEKISPSCTAFTRCPLLDILNSILQPNPSAPPFYWAYANSTIIVSNSLVDPNFDALNNKMAPLLPNL